ncbi:NAD(P)/FAD-dependent oxidoreductase [Aquibacillus koreensis]|uniref:NAD(P)/FAD-dependent oxidoreductase n=1 Tax=Aquibacillus koreensis TaxID=279446 RepID=A0A9X3WLV7_9BACI|nr:NAD(P)/FAD-dependent oxidoreductase [Aquibacillus koreensis]MCT2537812.1 NAD(P)/FAD-dependent oxidoreductase [Aquibacillus koreensis]MDC3421155.1 NAD(P)/FAD-dependent oxidoreductase [Aquibacillus koreensis]
MSIKDLNERVKTDLSYLAYGGTDWVATTHHPEGHVYDVVVIGGGQSGLGAAFGLLRERISNILILDENPEGYEGPWETYARMVTLRTPKHLTSVDLGVPSLTFRSWWEAQFGKEGWEEIDKIPRGDWMRYLRWYRNILDLPVINETKLELIEPIEKGLHRLHLAGEKAPANSILTRKVILATGIQGGGEWHVPSMISTKLPRDVYAHTSEPIPFHSLKNKKVAILGGGASAFDNANFALTEGVAEAHVFVRRKELPRVNPIRQMESSGMIERFHALSDHEKYTVIAHFFKLNQPPTNDTYNRASSWNGFQLHLGSPWLDVQKTNSGALVSTPQGDFEFDYLIISTGLRTDPGLRTELRLVEKYIKRWSDQYSASKEIQNPLLDAHPYLGNGFKFLSRDRVGASHLHGIFAFNYSALISCGISASALSGMRFGIPKLITEVADQLFLDNREAILNSYFTYNEIEFTGQWLNKEKEATNNSDKNKIS